MTSITITVNGKTFRAELNDSPTAVAIVDALPISGGANTWGDEIYFEIPVNMPQETSARDDVTVGELGYWPVGKAFCIFYGRTPASTDENPRAASPVNIIGKILDNAAELIGTHHGAEVLIEKA